MSAPCTVPAPGLSSLWYGRPDLPIGMQAFTLPDSGFGGQLGRGATTRTLMSGGAAVSRRPDAKRANYVANYGQLSADEADQYVAHYLGLYGPGPFCLLDPRWRNLLDLDASTMGGAVGQVRAWALPPIITQPYINNTIAPPAGVRSSVLVWPSPAPNNTLWNGNRNLGLFGVDTTKAVPWLPGVPARVSVWLKLASAVANAVVIVRGCGAEGATWGGTYFTSASATLTTSWQRVSVDLTATAWTAAQVQWLVPSIITGNVTVLGTDVHVAGAMVSYSPRLDPYVVGAGVPRMLIADPFPDTSTVWWRRSHAITFTEA